MLNKSYFGLPSLLVQVSVWCENWISVRVELTQWLQRYKSLPSRSMAYIVLYGDGGSGGGDEIAGGVAPGVPGRGRDGEGVRGGAAVCRTKRMIMNHINVFY